MIVDQGRIDLLGDQLNDLATWSAGLFTAPTSIVETNVLADLTEAAWTGYARQVIGNWSPSILVPPNAQAVPLVLPQFQNMSGADQPFAGWFLIDSFGKLTVATPVASGVVPNGAVYVLNLGALLTDG